MRYLIFSIVLVPLLIMTPSTAEAQQKTAKEKLREAKEMLDEGLIKQDEYETMRKRIMDEFAGTPQQEKDKDKDKQVLAKPTFACMYSGEKVPEQLYAADSYAEDASANEAVREILDVQGLVPNFVVRPANVPNAVATMFGSDRFILYQPQFFQQLKNSAGTNWVSYSVLAHEVGHHLQGHALKPGGSQPPLELEADEYSGFVLQRMGATLEQALAAMNKFGSEQDSPTHPGKAKRLAAIEKGWKRAVKKDPAPRVEVPKEEEKPEVAQKPRTRPCTHRIPCVHTVPCVHPVPCVHTMPCQHVMACSHVFSTPYGLRAAHQYDTMHPYDAAHPADAQHAADAQHEYDLAHPEGDPE